ncbi:gentamicin 3'-N-acetyltransferase [Advenella kashmirensis WT001]|uniref:Gentamicin 3'-N-acetyltransferase n=1 Tax=Advenella kashmirensis (strain DSM 17095 / LMG 22695 / WT001) TaxID=1036672 RepID=I3U765_ADVKW|nr:gentamicin 3'-N-acetyltransferase [Advenella kashmirensis WT001]
MQKFSSKTQYRRLLPGDVALLRQLNLLFSRAFDDPVSYESKPATNTYLTDFLAKDHVAVFVALNDGHVLGGLVAYALDKFEMARREYYIYDLAVDAGYRRQGIATALIRHLCEFAADHAGWVVYVQADRAMRRPLHCITNWVCRSRYCILIFRCRFEKNNQEE